MRSMIWSAVFVHLKGRACSFQSLIRSSSAVVSSPSEQNMPRSRQRHCSSANHAVDTGDHRQRALASIMFTADQHPPVRLGGNRADEWMISALTIGAMDVMSVESRADSLAAEIAVS
jgi:hypothetical protein